MAENLPDAIKSLPEIRAAYIKNLDNSKAISDGALLPMKNRITPHTNTIKAK